MGSTTEARCGGHGMALGGFSEGGDIQVRKRGTEGEETEQGAVRRVFLAPTGCGQQQQAKPRLALSRVDGVQQQAKSKLARAVDSEKSGQSSLFSFLPRPLASQFHQDNRFFFTPVRLLVFVTLS